jgi:hypothetical protein
MDMAYKGYRITQTLTGTYIVHKDGFTICRCNTVAECHANIDLIVG